MGINKEPWPRGPGFQSWNKEYALMNPLVFDIDSPPELASRIAGLRSRRKGRRGALAKPGGFAVNIKSACLNNYCRMSRSETPVIFKYYCMAFLSLEVESAVFAVRPCFFIRAEKFDRCMPTCLAAWAILPSATERAF